MLNFAVFARQKTTNHHLDGGGGSQMESPWGFNKGNILVFDRLGI